MPRDPRILIFFAANALLLFLNQLVNNALAGWSVYVVALGPMIVLPALRLRPFGAALCAALTGIWVDAALPSALGAVTVTMVLATLAAQRARFRWLARSPAHGIAIAQAANLALFAALFAGVDGRLLADGRFWLRCLQDAALSQIAVLAAGAWFLQFERSLLALFGASAEPDDSPLA